MNIYQRLEQLHPNRYSVHLVRDDGKTLIVDLVPADNERQAAKTNVWFLTPERWADAHGVKAFVNGKEIL